MQSKNDIAIVHAMAGMCGMYKLCVLFGTQTFGCMLSIVQYLWCIHRGCLIHVHMYIPPLSITHVVITSSYL